MKLFKKTYFALTLFMSVGLMVSCSSDNEINDTNTSANEVNFKSTTTDEYFLTEVYIDNYERPQGYMLSETATNEPMYFLDIDGTDFEVTPFDEKTQSVQHFASSSAFTEFYRGHDFEPIKVVVDPGYEEPNPGEPVAQKKRYTYGSPVHGPDGCTQGVYEATYVFGIRLTEEKKVYIVNERGNIVQAQVPCGEEYDPNK